MTSKALREFKYWPRYVSRVLRHNMVYCGEYLGWKFETEEHLMDRPHVIKDEECEVRAKPKWCYSEQYPWNMANRLDSYVFPDRQWTLNYADGRKIRGYLYNETYADDERRRSHANQTAINNNSNSNSIRNKEGQQEKNATTNENEEQTIFLGDRVQVLVGPDRGKIGLVRSLLPIRRMVIVEGLNRAVFNSEPSGKTNLREIQPMSCNDLPLNMDTEVRLIDPSNLKPCERVEWRYTESGERVRVNPATGRLIPLSETANTLPDTTNPRAYVDTPEIDTAEAELLAVSFKPRSAKRPENELLDALGVWDDPESKTRRPRSRKYYY